MDWDRDKGEAMIKETISWVVGPLGRRRLYTGLAWTNAEREFEKCLSVSTHWLSRGLSLTKVNECLMGESLPGVGAPPSPVWPIL